MNICPRCPRGRTKPCSSKRHQCTTCNGVAIIRSDIRVNGVNVCERLGTWITCPDCSPAVQPKESPENLADVLRSDIRFGNLKTVPRR